MADCFPLIKYIYVFVLFIFGFIGWNNPTLEIIGYSGVFVTQCIFTMLLLIDISNDSGRASKTLDFTLLQSVYSRITSTYKIPLYLVLLVGIFLQFTSSFLMMITTSTLYRKYQKIKMSRDSQYFSNIYKILFVTVTVLMMVLIFIYSTMFNTQTSIQFSPMIRISLATIIIGILGISSFNVYNTNKLSTYTHSSVDG